ncbi:MAG: calcium-translocating P-type ATPase, SERCA-type [Candidatus Woesearchaeota archaeon]|jgi:Ca2+-transporting ATPase|nr:calcium-translocating P-type ATPase, SERCA-type [Candidatus Woesearchaeota archaeon]MDP7181848.1 calcium-translocating P-type ATPase, SERCA-type [Candidatus Woesearchaeota archaeon]MDP7199024.1 calcium-translocating P-type ATPase, SERCA-type [Candidatus Woesearchaeota archaeon]MDP7467722.1 calcium-translocating P-type ATPase, SERCA-type [Candidatus Woesearchaeota archaeon]MDP7646806.1 calcium-translocating P-type ATPase, SERCA-type [Candidatus Woesearchaeota archaeon]
MFHDRGIKEVLEHLHTTEKGLSKQEATRRLSEGRNELQIAKPPGVLALLWEQFKSPLVWILIVAGVISAVLHERTSAYTIGLIIVLNAIFGFIQEYKAEQAIEKLKKRMAPKAVVIRGGETLEIPSVEVVPGDILVLETGTNIAADARLVTCQHLQAMESALTGESDSTTKKLGEVSVKATVADRTNMVFAGTSVTMGKANAVVVNTGMRTQIGKVASLLQSTKDEATPLEKHINQLAKWLGITVLILAALIFAHGVATGRPVFDVLLLAIALAVAAIPEGLPAIVTVTMGLGVQHMARRSALIRNMPSVETLGACTVICSDKTGTLTHNEMTVRKLYVNNEVVNVSGSGYDEDGKFSKDPKGFSLLLRIGAMNNNATLHKEEDMTKIVGDPTEGALLVSARKGGMHYDQLQRQYPRKDEIEFTSERKMMSTTHVMEGKTTMYTKGAPEVLVRKCTRIWANGRVMNLTPEARTKILKQAEKFANEALRVLAFSYGTEESDMVFVGLQAMIDPPRREARDAIKKCQSAGIKVIMITGDHMSTAVAVAGQLGLKGNAVEGKDLDKHANKDITVYARIEPAQKLHIVASLERKGHVVAMTGDGINDAPALKRADIGIAMGKSGTDVARDASDMVLADDNFASIVGAVEEGRRIFDNIRKFVMYLVSSNIGELLTVFLSIPFGMQMPVTAMQILWINLVTDGAPALALGLEHAEPKNMARPPRNPKEGVLTKHNSIYTLLVGVLMAVGTLGVFAYSHPETNLAYAQTMGFTTLVMFQLFNVLNQRSGVHSTFVLRNNKWIWWALLASVLLQVLVIYSPLNLWFDAVPLAAMDWVWCTLAGASVLVIGELVKFFKKA